jgi:sec-independent protein translocase protein TatC
VSESQSFWEHLDELRSSLIRIIVVVMVCAIVAFFFKDSIFAIVLGPKNADFITYRILQHVAAFFTGDATGSMSPSSVRLINTGLAQQFFLHVKTSAVVGFMAALPYVIYILFRFVSPALYTSERHHAIRLVVWGYVMFILGLFLSYFLVFPLTFRFLGMYQVSEIVENTVTIESYIDTLMTISLCMGIIFEIPLICWIMGRLGVINATLMKRFRKHVIVALLVIGAIITPTSDVFTLMLVSMPMWMLYELSIYIVGIHCRK